MKPNRSLPRPDEIIWRANAGRQTRFLSCAADEVLWGGEAGGGKSDAIVALPLRWVDHPRFQALILRREGTDLGPLLAKAHRIYRRAFPGAAFNGTEKKWTFPSGAVVRFAGCEHEKDAFAYQGDEFNLIGFDELTHFTRGQVLEITSRLRTTEPELPTIMRATSNPGGDGHEWVLARWAAWLDPTAEIEGLDRSAYPDRLVPEGVKLWFLREENGREIVVPRGTPDASSRTYLRSVRGECKQLDRGYASKLRQLDPVRRAQLEKGNWLAKPGAGKYFQRTWVDFVDDPPQPDRTIRYWDLAAGGDYAAGCRASRSGIFETIEGVTRLRAGPGEVRAAVFATAAADGPGVEIWIERDPGQAGKDQELTYVTAKELQGYTVRFRPKRVDKITAFSPFSAYAYASARLVKVVRGRWNDEFFDELEGFPEGANDDQCDAVSGAHAVLFGAMLPPDRVEADPAQDVVDSNRWETEGRSW